MMQINLIQEQLRAILIPIIPLVKQRRIVAELGELMSRDAQLEVRLAPTPAFRLCLVDGLLAEALAPA